MCQKMSKADFSALFTSIFSAQTGVQRGFVRNLFYRVFLFCNFFLIKTFQSHGNHTAEPPMPHAETKTTRLLICAHFNCPKLRVIHGSDILPTVKILVEEGERGSKYLKLSAMFTEHKKLKR